MRRGIGRPAGVRLAVHLALHRTAWLASIAATAIGAYVVSPAAQAAGQAALRRSVVLNGADAIGALFTSSGGKLGPHFCTASVVDSPAGDLLITAAHCLRGKSLSPAGRVVFAPGYHDGQFPHGTWAVTAEYVDAAWSASQDPDDDVAFLVVADHGAGLEQQTGAETLEVGRPAQVVQVTGYPDQTNEPLTCVAPARDFEGGRQMVFDCDNYTNGTSGGPFLTHINPRTGMGWVIGIIGGYQQGGFTPDVSYSPRFFSPVLALYQTAIAVVPAAAPG